MNSNVAAAQHAIATRLGMTKLTQEEMDKHFDSDPRLLREIQNSVERMRVDVRSAEQTLKHQQETLAEHERYAAKRGPSEYELDKNPALRTAWEEFSVIWELTK